MKAKPGETKSTIWRTVGGGIGRAGLFGREVRIQPTPSLRLEAQGGVRASPIFDADGTVYVADMAGGVQAFTPDGGERWRIRLPAGIAATPVLDSTDERLYVGTFGGVVYALNPSNGETVWRQEIPSRSDLRILSDLLFLPKQNLIILSSWGGNFCALDAKDGKPKFTWSAGISPRASAAATEEGTLYALRAEWTDRRSGLVFVSVDAETGKETEILFQPTKERVASRLTVAASPVIDENRKRVYFILNIDKDSVLHAMSLETGKTLWSKDFERYLTATPALLADGSVVIADMKGVVHVISPEGSRRDRYHTGAYYLLAGPVCDANGRIFVGDPQGRIHGIEPSGTGEVLFEAERAIQARPAFDPRGRLYAPSTDRYVYVFPFSVNPAH